MDILERANFASELKASGKANCTLSVLLAFKDQINIEEEKLREISSGFSAGMGRLDGTCGALVGAIMVAGLLKGNAAMYSRQLFSKFEELSGGTICKTLKGIDTGKVLCECPTCVYNAVLTLGEVLNIK